MKKDKKKQAINFAEAFSRSMSIDDTDAESVDLSDEDAISLIKQMHEKAVQKSIEIYGDFPRKSIRESKISKIKQWISELSHLEWADDYQLAMAAREFKTLTEEDLDGIMDDLGKLIKKLKEMEKPDGK